MSNTLKPAREWADHLPEPIRSQFLANCDNPKCAWRPDELSLDADFALLKAFDHDLTPEGGKYWNDIRTRNLNGEFDKPVIVWRDLTADELWEVSNFMDKESMSKDERVAKANIYIRKLLTQ
jgi:hypothetical protein